MNFRIGIPLIGGKTWVGGVSFIELTVKAITALAPEERPRLYLIVDASTMDRIDYYQPFCQLFDGFIYLGERKDLVKVPELNWQYCADYDELFRKIDFYFPVDFNVFEGRPAASWIHDFQHKYLPGLFSHYDIMLRDELCRRIAAKSKLVFCSSKAVERDFWQFYPQSTAITKALMLKVYPEDEWYKGNPADVQRQYGLPDRFVICCNQFWLHKNHKLLFEAVSLLRQQGQDVHLACTGETSDYRCREYFDELKKIIASLGINDLVHILGAIPRHDQIQLLRRSLFAVQPSLFEGLGLIGQECRALGKLIILSDLEVHFEHEYGIYFNRYSAEDLAAKMRMLLDFTQPGPDVAREAEAKVMARELAKIFGRKFCQMVEEVPAIFAADNVDKQPIVVATSINRQKNIELQKNAINSWLKIGFKVFSVNSPEDIEELRLLFPAVNFFATEETSVLGIRGVCLNSLLSCLEGSKARICGILCPDVFLSGDRLSDLLRHEVPGAVVYGDREDVKSISFEHSSHTLREAGFVFFDRIFLTARTKEAFFLDEPWWDVCLLLAALSKKLVLKKISKPLAYHVLHEDLSLERLVSIAETLNRMIPAAFPITRETVERYHYLLWSVINKHTAYIN